jgi:hypothetical protein
MIDAIQRLDRVAYFGFIGQRRSGSGLSEHQLFGDGSPLFQRTFL